jgi:hypothetical protein
MAKYAATGAISLEGDMKEINKRLEVNPKTKVPQILFTVYQHIFHSIYLLSSVLNTPYPPPDLLHPMQERIQILPGSTESESPKPQEDKTTNLPPTAKEQSTATAKPESTTKEANNPTAENTRTDTGQP